MSLIDLVFDKPSARNLKGKKSLQTQDRAAATRDPDGIRDSIVEEAMELFAHYGYTKTNIGDIARACEMSAGNLYRYFRNKQAIGHAVVARFFAAEDRLIAEVLEAGGTAEHRIRATVTAAVMHTVENLRRAPKIVELAEMICETEEGVAMVGEHVATVQARMTALIEEGVADGVFAVPDPSRAARAVLMGTKFFVVPFSIARHGLDNVEEDLALTLDLLCAGLRNGG